MFRKSLLFVLLTVVPAFHLSAEPEPLRALPVDPSEITPENAVKPAPPPAVAAGEIHALNPGEVKVPAWKRKPGSDSPLLDGLPGTEDAVRLQIYLDQSNFGPGIIDGKPGRFTVLAVQAWNEVHGHPANDLGPVLEAARKAVPHPFALATVPAIAPKWVNSGLSHDRGQQSKAKQMSYRSLAEFMAERFHSDVEFMLALNGSKNTWGVKVGGTLVVPNVKPFHVEALTGIRYETDPVLANRHAVVDTKKNQVRIYQGAPSALVIDEEEEGAGKTVLVKPNQALIASFPITPGKPQFIHYGVWELKSSVELPVWRYDKSLLETGKRSSSAMNIPPGPNSPVGVIWNGLSRPGIGLHGTADPETIGRARSAGCIRLANWDAIRIPTLMRPGATVEIR